MIYLTFKRLFDLSFSLCAIAALSPLMLAISILVRVTSPGPVLYKGVRAGQNNKSFKILKFRTMVQDAEKKGGFSTAVDDKRLTSIGRVLRRYKLDELPQFFNVIKGEMALVGPRPQVLFYTNKYSPEEKLILTVKPGITDLASLYFSDMDKVLGSLDVDETYAKKVEPVKNKLRLQYVRQSSYVLDMRILIETFFSVLGFHGVTGLKINPNDGSLES